jgi:hypothetical protein
MRDQVEVTSLILLQILLIIVKGSLIRFRDLECVISAHPNMCDTVYSSLATVCED